MNQLALEIVAFFYPDSGLGLTSTFFNQYSLPGRIRSSLYCRTKKISITSKCVKLQSWLVPECRGKNIDVVLLNHTTCELLLVKAMDVPESILSMTHFSKEEKRALERENRGLIQLNIDGTRWRLEDSYEVRPLCQGIAVETRSYGLVHV